VFLNQANTGRLLAAIPWPVLWLREALKVIKEENLPERAATLGKYFLDQLKTIKSPHIKEVRGRGLLIGIELKPEAGGARRFCEALKEAGLLCKETHDHVIRFAPPLVVKEKELRWAFKQVKRVFRQLS